MPRRPGGLDVGSVWRGPAPHTGPFELVSIDVRVDLPDADTLRGWYAYRHLSGGPLIVCSDDFFIHNFEMLRDSGKGQARV